MKKSLFALFICALAIASCTQNQDPETTTEMQSVTFTIAGIESGDLTRGEVADLLDATAPSGPFTLAIVSTSDPARAFTIKTGEEITLPCDTYSVHCSYVPPVRDYCWHGNIYQEPRFEISTTIEVASGQDEVRVPAAFDCWALVIDYTQVKKYLIQNKNGTYVDLTEMVPDADGARGICYISTTSAWTTQSPLMLAAVPKDEDNYETKFFTLVSGPNYEGTPVANGKWYSFSPVAVDKTSGSLGITFPAWGHD